MILYTNSGKKIKATKVNNPAKVSNIALEGRPVPLQIDNEALTAFCFPGGSPFYKFFWGGDWYSIRIDEVEKLPIHEQMTFITSNKDSKKRDKKPSKSPANGPFITIIQHPEHKGFFVGGVFRTTNIDDDKAIVENNGNTFEIPSSCFRRSFNGEVFSFFIKNAGGYCLIKQPNKPNRVVSVSGISDDVKNLFYTDSEQKSSKKIPLDRCFLPSDQDILDFLVSLAANEYGFKKGVAVKTLRGASGVIQDFVLGDYNKLLAKVKSKDSVSVENVRDLQLMSTLPSLRGDDLFNHYKNEIDKILESDDLSDSTTASLWNTFFSKLVSWSNAKLKGMQK